MRVVGRYLVHDEAIAAGGMATVHLGRLRGSVGFSRTVAIKQLRADYADDAEFCSMLLDEARLASRIHHPNVVQTLDVETARGELLIVMEYVCGESLARLLRASRHGERQVPQEIAAAVVIDVLHGLHAAHVALDPRGEPLDLVHRDVSPHNVLVGVDGVARVLDFGVAKARGRLQTTREGQLKGKLAYMAPEQIHGQVSPRTDVFAAAAVLWEILVGRPVFEGGDEAAILGKVLFEAIPSPCEFAPAVSPELARIVRRGLERDPAARFASALEMAHELERAVARASGSDVGRWVEAFAEDALAERRARVAEIERADEARPEQGVVASVPAAAMATLADGTATNPVPGLARSTLDRGDREAADTLASAITSSGSPRRPTRAARWKKVGIVAALAITVGGVAISFTMVRNGDGRSPSRPAAADRVSSAAPNSTPGTTPEPADREAAARFGAAAVAPVPPTPPATAPSVPTPQRSTKTIPHAPARKAVNCSPPYVVDDLGLRHYRPECL